MTAKFDIEKFDGNNDFGLWRLKMHALLVQNGLHKALRGKNALSDYSNLILSFLTRMSDST